MPLEQPPPAKAQKPVVWFEGDLWKLNGCVDDESNLMNWRRRFFTLCFKESLGLVLDYRSEKRDLKKQLGCVIQGPGMSKASIATVGQIAVSLPETEKQSFEEGIRMYDIAVHKKSFHDETTPQLPSQLERAVVSGVDKDGEPKSLSLGWTDATALAEWLMVIKTAIQHHFQQEAQIQHFKDASHLGSLNIVGSTLTESSSTRVD